MISPRVVGLRVYGEEVTETVLHEAAGRCVSIMGIVRPRRSAWTRVVARGSTRFVEEERESSSLRQAQAPWSRF